MRAMMMGSRETFVRYTMPLGLHHLIGGDHYAPMPENADPRRLDWSAIYYHRADGRGIGFDRTASGSNAVGQYRSPLREQWGDPATVPPELLLWFHRLPWDRKLPQRPHAVGGDRRRTTTQGAREAADLERQWTALKGAVDPERYEAVRARLRPPGGGRRGVARPLRRLLRGRQRAARETRAIAAVAGGFGRFSA